MKIVNSKYTIVKSYPKYNWSYDNAFIEFGSDDKNYFGNYRNIM